MNENEKSKITIYLSNDVIEDIKIQAIKEKTSVSKIIEYLLRQYLESK